MCTALSFHFVEHPIRDVMLIKCQNDSVDHV